MECAILKKLHMIFYKFESTRDMGIGIEAKLSENIQYNALMGNGNSNSSESGKGKIFSNAHHI